MGDILMVATPSQYKSLRLEGNVKMYPTADFWQQEDIVKQHDEALWSAFHTHGKYQQIVAKADMFFVATNENGQYLASALVITIGDKWIVEYVMAHPKHQRKGAGTVIMNAIVETAKNHKAQWVTLNCDPEKNNGQLPKFYSKFGFKPV